MNSNIIPRFCLSHTVWRHLFSPLLSNLIYLMSVPYLVLRSSIHMGSSSVWSLFHFKKKLWLQSLNLSTTINQCLFPPILSCLNGLMSMNNLYPVPVSLFSLGHSLALSLLVCMFHMLQVSLSTLCPYTLQPRPALNNTLNKN